MGTYRHVRSWLSKNTGINEGAIDALATIAVIGIIGYLGRKQ